MLDRACTWAWQAVATVKEWRCTDQMVEPCGSLQSAAAACTHKQWLTTDLRVTASAGLNSYKLEALEGFHSKANRPTGLLLQYQLLKYFNNSFELYTH